MHIPKTLVEAVKYYSDEQVCIDAVASLRWPDGKPVCPKCGIAEGDRKHYWLATQKRWKCYSCRKQFSVKVDSVFEDSPLGLDKWLIALWMLCNCKNGVSSHEIARELGIAQKSAWHLLHRLRLVLKADNSEKMGATDGGIVEVDEVYVGGDAKNRHLRAYSLETSPDWFGKRKVYIKGKVGRGVEKTPVFGMLDRDTRKVRAQVVPNVKREALMDAILSNVEHGSKIYSDNFKSYQSLKALEFIHETVNHVDQYVRGEVHTNTLEGFWSLLKRGLKGTYVAVEPFHLDRYIDEQAFRYNNRATKDNPLTNSDRFAIALTQVASKRLTWKELTGKEEGSEF